ncbi:MAG: efflux RND transporter periplasmic adaptor subunit [Allosphingosinicella sp.]|uniref:efflux RND transporter periplasmic adaptor subunit n=1 Tax=Allosphingosinicella sp. TaxID=2823234 RepID=UPI0039221121
MGSRSVWLLLLLLALAAGGGWYAFGRGPTAVEGTQARLGEAVEVVYATGVVEPRQPVDVASRITAPIVEILVEEGDRVARGQPLVRLEDGEQRAAIAQLAAQTANAEAEEGRALALFERGFLAAAGRDRAVTAARSARAAESQARARLDQYVIRAGLSGVVLRREAEPGDMAGPSRKLLTLGDPALLRVTATVDERDIPRVVRGQRALMSSAAYPDRVYRGTVRDVTPGGDPNQRAFRVRILPDSPENLPIGLTLEVNIVTRAKAQALLVPTQAVRDGHVWALGEGGEAERRPVRTGIEGAERIEILEGLAPGACIFTSPPASLSEGGRVEVRGC